MAKHGLTRIVYHPADLMKLLGVGEDAALQIARKIGVRVVGGRRWLVSKERLAAYLDGQLPAATGRSGGTKAAA